MCWSGMFFVLMGLLWVGESNPLANLPANELGIGSLEVDGARPPTRPRVFTSSDDLRNYLEALSKYYAVAGRPRFGKRGIEKFRKDLGSNFNDGVIDLYDIFVNERPRSR